MQAAIRKNIISFKGRVLFKLSRELITNKTSPKCYGLF